MKTYSTESIKYIDGIRPPQQRTSVPVQIKLDFDTPTDVIIKKTSKIKSVKFKAPNSNDATPLSDFYAQLATRAWSQGKKTPLRRSVKQHARNYLNDQRRLQQSSLVLNKEVNQGEIKTTYEYLVRGYFSKVLTNLSSAAIFALKLIKRVVFDKSFLVVAVCQFIVIIVLLGALINIRQSFANYKAQSQEQVEDINKQYDAQWNDLQKQWKNTLEEARATGN